MAHPPVPERVVDRAGPRPLHRQRHLARASRSSCTTASWSTARPSATAPIWARTSPPTTCAARPTSSSAPTAAPASDSAARRTIEDFRTNRYDKRTETLTLTAPQAQAFRALVPYYSRVLLRPDDRARPAAQRDHRPHAAAPADRLLRVDGVGGVDRPPRSRLLLHQQLAVGAARRQQADGQRDRLVGAVADRAAGRHRAALRRLRALGAPAGLARARAGDAVLPRARATSRSRRRSARARGSSS